MNPWTIIKISERCLGVVVLMNINNELALHLGNVRRP
jgi:hypothetical protein